MKGTCGDKTDPMERPIERALRPGEFIYDRARFSFVSGLNELANEIKKRITAEPGRALSLCEAFLASCHTKAEQLDDSSGSFGHFAKDLICRWVKARQSSGADPGDTAATLLGWMDNTPAPSAIRLRRMSPKYWTRLASRHLNT